MWVFLRDNILDTDEIFKGDEKDHIFPKFQWHIHIYLYPENCFEGLAAWSCFAGRGTKQATNRSHVIPQCPGSGTRFSAALCSALRLWLLFLLSLPTSVQTHPSPTAVLNLLSCCSKTAQPWEKYILYTCLFPALACRDSYTVTGARWFIPTNPESSPLQFSLPLRSPHQPSWFEKSAGGGLRGSSPRCDPQHSVPEEASWEQRRRAFKAAPETICRRALKTNTSFSSCPRGSGAWRRVRGKC